MSDVILNVDLSAIKGMAQIMGANAPAAEGTGEFGKMLGVMMTPVENAEAVMPVMPDMTVGADAIIQDEEISKILGTMIPKLSGDITPKGAQAFIETIREFIKTGEMPKLDKLWADVSPKEKNAFAELFELIGEEPDAAADMLVEAGIITEGEHTVNELAAVLTAECDNIIRTDESKKQDKEKTEIPSEHAAAYMMMKIITPEAQSGDVKLQTEGADAAIAEEIQPAVRESAVVQPDILKNIVAEGAPEYLQDVKIPENIQNVYSAAENTEPESFEMFFKELSAELKAEVVSAAKIENTAVQAEMVKSDNPDIQTFAADRQAFMSRVNRHFENTDAAVNPSAVQDLRSSSVQETILPEVSEIPIPVDDTMAIAQRITEQIKVIEGYESTHNGGQELTIKLTPDDMGEIKIKITSTDDGIVLSFAAEKAEAAGILGDKASALADALAARGIKLKEMSVTEQIFTSQSDNSALEYMGRDGYNPFGNHGSSDRSNGQSRHFVFDDDGAAQSVDGVSSDSEIYYDKEAKLWVSV